jgi:protein-glutamine gamma-glutamyltransferase
MNTQLTALAFASFLVTLPYLGRLPIWLAILFLALIGYRLAINWRKWPVPSTLVLVLVAAVVAGGAVTSFETIFGRDGGTTLLLGLSYLKLIEAKNRRDTLLMVLLGYFLTTANFFFAQDIGTALITTATLLALSGLLLFWERPMFTAPRVFRQIVALFMQALPLTIVLFLFFPRPDAPLWSLPLNGSSAQSGLANEVTPGAYNSLAKNDAVAFRAEFRDLVPAQSDLYWRGPVYDQFDGRTWKQGAFDFRPSFIQLPRKGQKLINYSITLEPNDRPWLLALDWAFQSPARSRISARFQAMAQPGSGRRRFDLVSSPQAQVGLREYQQQIDLSLQLPPGGNPQARALAQSWQARPPLQRLDAAIAFFRDSKFIYTLNPPLLPLDNNVDTLIFGSKQGFCEHYAGAFVFLMRAAGVPARMVGGYQGGQPGLDGSYWIVRQSDAHAWAEVWFEGLGWQRLDPTALIAPNRITQGLAASVAGAADLAIMSRSSGGWWRNVLLQLDAVQNTWNNWIISYDGNQQRALFERLGLGVLGSWQYWLVVIVGLVIAVTVMLWSLRRTAAKTDAVQAAYLLLCQRLAVLGVVRGAAEPASRYAERIGHARPALAAEIRAISEEYEQLRYGDMETPAQVRAFRQKVQQFKIKKAQ